MPQKRNNGGMQEYVPAGNSAGGEYANESGSNVHFASFKKPDGEEKKTTKPSSEIKKPKAKTTQEQFQKNHEELFNLVQKTKDETLYAVYKNGKLNFLSRHEYSLYPTRTLDEAFSLMKFNDIRVMSDEDKNKLTNLLIEDINLCMTLPSYTKYGSDEDWASLDLTTSYGKESLMRSLYFGEYNQQSNSLLQDIFSIYYKDVIEKVSQKTQDKINKYRSKLGNEYIKNNFKKSTKTYSIDEALAKTNPNYDKGEEYNTNCQRCTYAYELLRRGYDVEVLPNDYKFGKGDSWKTQMCYKEQYDISASTYKGVKKQTDDIIKKAGNGARFSISVQWKGSGGHCFIGENVNGEVKYFDAQTNNNNVDDYFKKVNANVPVFVGRMDNADFSGAVKYTAKGV